MSGIEVAGMVLGAFPIILNCLEYYRKGFEPLEEWWQFRTHFIAFIDDVRHQMMKYNENMIRLLDPIITSTDTDNLAALLMVPLDRSQPGVDLEQILEGRLASELDRFLRIINRMHELMLSLNKLLQIEDGKISWVDNDQQRPWQWHFKRIQISFSKGKHKKVKKLAGHNRELEDILGYSERIIPIADRRKTSEPVTRFEKLRQHAYGIYQILAKQWRCQRSCRHHTAHLRLRAEEIAISLNILFQTGGVQQSTQMEGMQEIAIRRDESVKPPSSINVSYVSQSDPITAVQQTVFQQQFISHANPDLKHRIMKKLQNRISAMRSPVKYRRSLSEPVKKIGFGLDTSRSSTTSSTRAERPVDPVKSKSTLIGALAEVQGASNPLPEDTAGFGPIDDICTFLTEQDRTAGTLDDDDDFQSSFVLSKLPKEQLQFTDKAMLHSFCELLDAHHQMKINVSRRDRFEIATHVASALLQTHLSPWLSPKWTKNDFYFLVDMEAQSICSRYPLVCREFAATTSSTTLAGEDAEQNLNSQQESEEETRARLFTLGVMILELMFGHNIEACQFRSEYFGVDGRPNDQTDISTARRWSRRVLGESGPDISDVVRRCLDCSFGPQPSFADGRFREAVYAGVILPLASYTKLWPEVMP
ncbi:hypothetical protein N8I77_008400 [Diaporthe amygdali]|uniref:DUF7580 domain-containing protein n=1 Tax=Phomopsis amygdali TaxID=1214568 RepID=A0AAD9W2I7_PHOAM|nr:hypothetical protein N8I77_008400 [Diaporthe amygdali]